jgi:thiol-disulfide isomerase/thioredoxin
MRESREKYNNEIPAYAEMAIFRTSLISQLIFRCVIFLIFIQFSFIFGTLLYSQTPERPKILGEISWDKWKNTAGWNDYSASKYQPNIKKINLLKSLIKEKEINFIIFASSFCDECMHEVPILFRIFEFAGIDSSKIMLVGLDENSQEPSGIYKNYDIKSVPTLIILSKNIIVGKVEPPDNEWTEFIIEYLQNFQSEKK